MRLCAQLKTMKILNKNLIINALLLLFAGLGAHAQSQKLTGNVIGTETCYDYSTGSVSTKINTPANAFDGNLETFVATYNNSHTWVGLDLGTPHIITKVGFCPRKASNGASRTVLGLFEGANDPDFMDAVPLYLIGDTPESGVITYADVDVSRGFRYVRYCGPSSSRCNIAEVEFYGYEGEGDDSKFYQITQIPTLSYRTFSGQDPYDKVNELEANMCLIYDGGALIQEYPITARIRGNASAGFSKKPYRIKFNDGKSHHMMKGSATMESPAKAKKWTLINNYGDKTLMRNIVAFEVSRRIGMDYTVYCQPVDLIVNGEYKGCYQLCDQITPDANRVPITEMEPTDVEEPEVCGGYLVEVDAYAGSESSMFYTNKGMPVTIKAPGEDEIVPAQSQYVKKAFNLMESAVWASNYSDPETGYRTKMDVESFLKNFLVGEFSGNTDTFWSTYMYKDRYEETWHVGPCWDFDLAFDNDNRIYPVNNHSDWIYRTGGSCASGMSSFVSRIIKETYASNRMRELWAEARETGGMTADSLIFFIDSMENAMKASADLNFKRWPILNQTVHQNAYALGSYAAEVDMVRSCVRGRIDWFDNKLAYGDPIDPTDPDDGKTMYEISSPTDLIAFMKAVNSGKTNVNAKLLADIDMSDASSSFKPIGNSGAMYQGTFDGQGHRISNLKVSTNQDYTGFFGCVAGDAVIKNLILDSTCSISGNAFVGLIGGSNSSGTITMENLGNEGTVKSTNQNAGGIIGCNMSSAAYFVIRNCYVTGTINGGHESAAISGWVGNNCEIYNTYSLATVSGNDSGKYFIRSGGGELCSNCFDINGSKACNAVNKEMAASGELCYLLNQDLPADTKEYNYYQTLGIDEYPVPTNSHAVVYKDAEGYNNGSYIYNISTADDLAIFAKVVNSGRSDMAAELLNDLDLKDVKVTPIGTEARPFKGIFNGNNHLISNLNISSSGDCVGLFGTVTGGAHILQLTLASDCSISGNAYVGLIGASTGEGTVTLESLGNEGSVTAAAQNAGGIIGCNRGSTASFVINNCYVSGTINGKNESGAISGWLGKEAQVSNCYDYATVTGYQTGKAFARFDTDKPATFTNCYDSRYAQSTISKASKDKIESGELCYLLNQSSAEDVAFYQTLNGIDNHPVLIRHAVVLQDGIKYVNSLDYTIADAQDLMGFATLVNSGLPRANAVVTADLDMKGCKMTPIGNSTYMYKGTFNGDGHIISNATISGENYTGLFGMVTGGCNVGYLTMDATCSIQGQAFVAGFIGGSNGSGDVIMENLGFEGKVKASAQNGGGIIGCNMSSSATFTLVNCYNTGLVTGQNEAGALSGWVGNNATVKNCYATADVEGIDGSAYLFRGSATVTNSYAISGGVGTSTSAANVQSGKLCYQLNRGDISNSAPYRQNLSESGKDSHPVLLSDHLIVTMEKENTYVNIEPKPNVPIESITLSAATTSVVEGNTLSLTATVSPEDASSTSIIWSSSDPSVATVSKGIVTGISEGKVTITATATDGSGVVGTIEITVVSSKVEIASADDLMAFAQLVNNGNPGLSAKLTADIDMLGIEDFVPIGNEQVLYTGTFDGQGHTIDNLNIARDEKYVGLIGAVDGGATVRNLVLGSGCNIQGLSYVGIIGTSLGSGTITIDRVGNEGRVSADEVNAGGIIGCNMGSSASFVISNCYVCGEVVGAGESALLSGWVGSNAQISNCWVFGTIEGTEGSKTFYRGAANVENCYNVYGNQATAFTAQEMKDGTLCYMLNASLSTDAVIWRQTLDSDEHPVFDANHGIVYLVNGKFYNDADAIEGVTTKPEVQDVFGLDGVQRPRMRKGINIVRTKDGEIRKVQMK